MSVTHGPYAEDLTVGTSFTHWRGRTISQADNARWTLATLNTAQGHFNVESMRDYFDGQFDRPIVNGALVLGIAIGLTSEDLSENQLAEVGMDEWSMHRPVFDGDTVFAASEILEVSPAPGRPDGALVRYRINVRNQRQEPVCSLVRVVIVKRRSYWADRDIRYTADHWPLDRSPAPGQENP